MVAVLACAVGLAFALVHHPRALDAKPTTSSAQGCVNEGNDRRMAGTAICWAQQRLSWKSESEPRFVLLGSAERTSVGLAWPPYFVFNSPDGSGHWRMFHIGFRYDRAWRGYIFPTVALKVLPSPLRY